VLYYGIISPKIKNLDTYVFYMNRFNNLWNIVEKISIYVIGILFILIPILIKLFPSLNTYVDQQYFLSLIAALILLTFRYIDKNLSLQQRTDFVPVRKFTSEIVKILEEKKIKKLCIFANNGYKYYDAIVESGVQVKELNILVRNFDDINAVKFPLDSNIKKEYKQSSDRLLERLSKLHKTENIESVIIHRYQFDSILHFMIIDNSLVHFGLLKPVTEFPGSEVLNSFIVSNESINGQGLINNFLAEFDAIFTNFSDPLSSNKI
jgi:hypothetical protein